ncbi:hypothetical protein Tco_0926343 [Tanacetum coccineum]|uniref:RNA-directed DNA polymerase, eukaryota n=1 Tax=Tanacetum coccineum TaxID=301880 RepID=A0ABQ5DFT5_9ASTR
MGKEKSSLHNAKNSLQNDLISIDKDLERGNVSDDILLNRMDLNRRLQDIKLLEVKDLVQKSKIKWAIEGDEKSNPFHATCHDRLKLNAPFHNRLSSDQVDELDRQYRGTKFVVSETQSAFVANRQILDGPFILNEMLNWCKRKKKQAMFFKVDPCRYKSLSPGVDEWALFKGFIAWARLIFSSFYYADDASSL